MPQRALPQSVFVTVIGDSFAGFASNPHWLDLFTSAFDCGETFASIGDCLKLLPQRAIVLNCLLR